MRRASERGVTLLEMMVTMGLMTVIIGGIVMFVATHTRMTAGAFDRTDIQRSGRGALTILEDKIGNAGLGLPKFLAIKSYAAADSASSACANSPKLEVAGLDFEQQWTVSSTDTGVLNLTSATPTPGPDVAIDPYQWLFIYHSVLIDVPTYGSSRGHGMVQVSSAGRAAGAASIPIGSAAYSAAQLDLDLSATSELNRASGRDMVVLLADVSGFGMDCTNGNHPYLYWENNGSKVPIASNVATPALGGVTGLQFRFFLDTTGPDGVPDGIGDAWDASPGVLTVDPAAPTGEQDNVTAVEVTLVLRSDTPDPQLNDYRKETFTLVIQTPNIHTQVDVDDTDQLQKYFFVDNTGI